MAALRDREIASVARYQRLFREFIGDWMGDEAKSASLRAELMSAAVVAAHNHVLRRWLRGETTDPVGEVDEAMRDVLALFPTGGSPTSGAGDHGRRLPHRAGHRRPAALAAATCRGRGRILRAALLGEAR